MKKTLAFILALLMMLSLFVGCDAKKAEEAPAAEEKVEETKEPAAEADDEGYKIAFLGSMNTDESILYFGQCAADYAEAEGIGTVTIFDANADPQKQSNMVADCVADGYDALLIIAVDPVAIVPAVKAADEAGVAVVMLGCDVDPSGAEYRIASVTAEHYDSGVLAAENILAQFPDGAKGVMIEGHPGEDTSNKRHNGFVDTIEGSNIEILDSKGAEGWDSAKAMAIMEDFVTKYGDDIDFVYSHWDNGSVSICQVLEQNGMEDVYVVSIDGCRVGFDLLKEGKIGATMFQDIKKQSEVGVDTIVEYLTTGKVANEVVDTGWEIITADNCDFDPGW